MLDETLLTKRWRVPLDLIALKTFPFQDYEDDRVELAWMLELQTPGLLEPVLSGLLLLASKNHSLMLLNGNQRVFDFIGIAKSQVGVNVGTTRNQFV